MQFTTVFLALFAASAIAAPGATVRPATSASTVAMAKRALSEKIQNSSNVRMYTRQDGAPVNFCAMLCDGDGQDNACSSDADCADGSTCTDYCD